jgi:hypothetical protein
MNTVSKLETLRAAILDRVTVAARGRDITEVARWSEAAKECDLLMKETQALKTRISVFEKSIHDLREEAAQPIMATHLYREAGGSISPSAKAEGNQVRTKWVQTLQATQGIDLTGHGTQYRTAQRASVGIPFANEKRPNRWFLGLADKPMDIIVLLCRTSDQQMYDIILPMVDLSDTWKRLSRSKGQVKFNVEKEADELILSIPGGDPLPITQYKGNYRPLR